jgi:uncharacterized Zn-finger protein
METKCCSRCNEIKEFEKFVDKKNFCKDCKNLRYRQLRSEKNKIKLEQIENDIGKDNKKCSYCDKVFHKSYFKCKKCLECKRKWDNDYNKSDTIKEKKRIRRHTDHNCKFKHLQNSRIRNSLGYKSKKTIEYLGCNTEQYFNWLKYNFIDHFCLENHGKEWHIDHVIPLSTFDLTNEEEQLIAFNWRNTMPLSCKENLSKNKKIIEIQIEQHLKKLVNYHNENKLDLPQVFIDLFATRPNCGKPP